jgi:hypothetical protein
VLPSSRNEITRGGRRIPPVLKSGKSLENQIYFSRPGKSLEFLYFELKVLKKS